eukprot:jgi/Astpho2/2704/Aster-00890
MSSPRPQPTVWVARVDCADQAPICNRFKIRQYPTLRWGLPAQFLAANNSALADFTDHKHRNPEGILKWLSEVNKSQYSLSAEAQPNKGSDASRGDKPSNASEPPLSGPRHADAADLELATRELWGTMSNNTVLLSGADRRAALTDMLQLMAGAHPVERCQLGSEAVLTALPQAWPEGQAASAPAMQQLQICGPDAAPREWVACTGSRPGARGYTCGLWMLFHALAGKVEPEKSGGADWARAIRGWVKHFFGCADCAEHFMMMAERPDALDVTSRRDAVLWMWKAHNEVNARLARQEKLSVQGDPAFPKVQFPPAALCPLCRAPSLDNAVHWNEDEVYRFLLAFYGQPGDGLQAAAASDELKARFKRSRKELQLAVGQGGHSSIAVWLAVGGFLAAGVVMYARNRRQTFG